MWAWGHKIHLHEKIWKIIHELPCYPLLPPIAIIGCGACAIFSLPVQKHWELLLSLTFEVF